MRFYPFLLLPTGDVECQQKYYLERYQKAVVSCVYERDFHTVRWYFSGTDTSFLRIDGSKKSGSGYLSGEYDIEDDGSMVINAVNIQHERNYTISILHVDGSSSKTETMILVKGKHLIKKLSLIPFYHFLACDNMISMSNILRYKLIAVSDRLTVMVAHNIFF